MLMNEVEKVDVKITQLRPVESYCGDHNHKYGFELMDI